MLTSTQKKRNSIVEWFIAVFILLFLSVVSFASAIRLVSASTTGTLTVDGLSTTESGAASWTLNGATISGSAAGTGGCNSASQTGTLTLKNTKGASAELSFTYQVTLNSGTCSVGGASVSSDGTYTYGPTTIANNGTVALTITSAKAASTTTINVTNISLVVDREVTGTFLPSPQGTYTVNGTTVSGTAVSITQSSTQSFNVVASNNSQYEFYGWHIGTSESGIDSTQVESTSSSYGIQRDANFFVKPEYMRVGTAKFIVDGAYYNNLGLANNAAKTASKKVIIPVGNGTVFDGDYEISSGVTLLIPCDSTNTVMTTSPSTSANAYTTPSEYLKLTLADGCSIDVKGAISVASVVAGKGQTNGNNGQPSGPNGRIYMEAGSSITIENNANLYCWGYIYGNGFIEAKSGAKVYECFQMKNFRGGTCTRNMVGNSQKVFPFNQYYVQNIEVTLKMNAGATEQLFSCVYMSSSLQTFNLTFIGNSSSGMFRLTSGYIIKKYIPSTDRLLVEAYGAQLNLSSVSVSISIVSLNSSDYVLPINSNITISLHDSSTVTTSQDICFFPGSVVEIDSTSIFKVNNSKNVYVYDSADWNNATNFYVVGYTPSNGTTAKRTTADLIDAEFNLNGTIEVASGAHFYTTESGANIHSSGKTGQITFASVSNNSTTYQVSSTSPDYYSMTVVNAKLKNGQAYIGTSEEYYSEDVVAGEIIYYNATLDKWGKTAQEDRTITVHFRDSNNPNNSYDASYLYPSESFTFPTQTQAGFTNNDGYLLRRWVDSDNEVYSPGYVYEGDIGDGITFYAYYGGWLTDSNAVTFYMYKTSNTTETYPYGIETVEQLGGTGSETETYLFNQNGVFCGDTKIVYFSQATYPNGDNKYYYVINGILGRNAGVVFSSTEIVPEFYYFITADGTALVNGVYYINTNLNSLLEVGYYEIALDGKIIVSENPHHITNDYVYDDKNHLTLGYGLFCLSGENPKHFYYCKQDGTIVKNQTFYVSKINGCWVKFDSQESITVEPGLYYFDNNGYMWYGNNVLGTNAPVEYGVIVSGKINGVTVTMGMVPPTGGEN